MSQLEGGGATAIHGRGQGRCYTTIVHRTAFQGEELVSPKCQQREVEKPATGHGRKQGILGHHPRARSRSECSTSLTVRTFVWLKLGDNGWERRGQENYVNS